MGAIDSSGAIHIKWWQTPKETVADSNVDVQCEWAQRYKLEEIILQINSHLHFIIFYNHILTIALPKDCQNKF